MFHANIDQYEFARNVINTGLTAGWIKRGAIGYKRGAISYKRHFNFSLFKQWAIHRIRAARIDGLRRTRNFLKQT